MRMYEPTASTEGSSGSVKPAEGGERPPTPDRFPPYTRSLLKIEVPVTVTLAERRFAVEEILSLGPGSILQFDKGCDEALDLEVGNRRVAQGEAVKVGDKFGLRVTAVVLPEERFEPISGSGGA
jgi:flagellar motor switch protein FliN